MNTYFQKKSEFIFQIILIGLFSILAIVMLYPFLTVLAKSLSQGVEITGKKVGLIPVNLTFENYKVILNNSMLSYALLISIARTIIGSFLHLLVTSTASYAMSKRFIKGRKLLMIFFLVPMYFGGGMLPTYILIAKLNLMNNFLVYILPTMFSTFDMLIMVTYFRQLPESFEESVKIDGASDVQIFIRIILPLSAPILATITLFHAVWQWNSWFDAILYVNKAKLQPLQAVLYQIINSAQAQEMLEQARYGIKSDQVTFTAHSVIMATLCFTIFPIVMVYPFLQKYFVKGIMIGGIKG